MLVTSVHYSDAADFGWLESLFREHDRIFVILDDVDLLATEFANDGLHTHALHPDAGADRVDVFVFRHDGDLGALTGFARDGANLYGAIVDFRNFRLEQML